MPSTFVAARGPSVTSLPLRSTTTESGLPCEAAIVSGFLATEGERVREALKSAGLGEQRRVERGEWGALLASRPRRARAGR